MSGLRKEQGVKAAEEVAKTLIKYHRLIYSVSEDQRLDPLGTGVLLRVDNSFFLVTAAHVLDENTHETTQYRDLATYGKREAVILNGGSFRTSVPRGKTRREDRIDVGFILLESEAVAQIGEDRFWPIAQIDLNDTGTRSALYGAFGYPASLNCTIDPNYQDVVNPRPFTYTALLRPTKAYKSLGVGIETHLLLAVSQNKTRRSDGIKAKLPDLHGMSGGGLWRYLGDELGTSVSAPCLLGILIEWHKCQEGGLLAARMSFVVESIRLAYPDLSDKLPRSKLININSEIEV